MKSIQKASGIEINPKLVGAFFTEKIENRLRLFCFFINGSTSQFELAADENLDNLHSFNSKLNMDETCSSIILDEVVQGRVYVRSEDNYWLYTLLSSPAGVIPLFDGNISDLPWKQCWRSQSVDVLEYGQVGDPVHCFAIRTQIGESDATRLVKDSWAFINPLSPKKRKTRRGVCLALGTVLVLLGILIAWGAVVTKKQRANGNVHDSVSSAKPSDETYYLLYNRQITGPYPVKLIASMNSGGLLKPETMCRPESATEWTSLSTLFPPQPAK